HKTDHPLAIENSTTNCSIDSPDPGINSPTKQGERGDYSRRNKSSRDRILNNSQPLFILSKLDYRRLDFLNIHFRHLDKFCCLRHVACRMDKPSRGSG